MLIQTAHYAFSLLAVFVAAGWNNLLFGDPNEWYDSSQRSILSNG